MNNDVTTHVNTDTITPLTELGPMLKQLRLSGITESLDRRNREAIEHKMTYPEFLALIIQDEAARRDQKKYATRLRRVGFRSDKTLESFDSDFNPNIDRAMVKELVTGRFINEKVCILLNQSWCGSRVRLHRLCCGTNSDHASYRRCVRAADAHPACCVPLDESAAGAPRPTHAGDTPGHSSPIV